MPTATVSTPSTRGVPRDPASGTVLPLAATAPLTWHDRCDAKGFVASAKGRMQPGSCGAAALVRAWIPQVGLPLFFCGHHFNRHSAGLASVGAYIHNEQ